MRRFIKQLPVIRKVVKLKDLFLTQINAILARVEVIEQYQYAMMENQTALLQSAVCSVESSRTLLAEAAKHEEMAKRAEAALRMAHQDIVRRVQVLRELHERDKIEETAIGPIDFVEEPVPNEVNIYFVGVYKALRRLNRKGFAPDFIIDAGASNGDWSKMAKMVFPGARFILIEPLAAKYRNEQNAPFDPSFEVIGMALSDRSGTAQLNVAWDLISSSFCDLDESSFCERIPVPVTTLDRIAAEREISGHGLLKLDIQYSEDRALAGAEALLPNVDVAVLELALKRDYPDSKVFFEMMQLMDSRGFRYADDGGEYRLAKDGTLSHKDAIFVRGNLFP